MQRTFTALLLSVSLFAVSAGPAGASSPGSSKSTTAQKPAPGRAKMLLKLGAMKTDPEFARLTSALSSASRQALGDLPGIRVLDDAEDADAAATKHKPPVVLITGKLCDVEQKPEGEDVVVSAKVEYFLHRMPGQSIAAVVSGSAKTKVARIQVKKKRLREQLEVELVNAAVESAVKRTVPALKAAVD